MNRIEPDMNRRQMRAAVTTLIEQLGPIPRPWRVDDLVRGLELARGRRILLHPMRIPALPFGLWYDDGRRDHIIYRAGMTDYYRDHVILHELCHMLARHNTDDQSVFAGDDSVRGLIERAIHSHHSDDQERFAELFASKVLGRAVRAQGGRDGSLERHAAALFGVG
jgi:hypothetical protein